MNACVKFGCRVLFFTLLFTLCLMSIALANELPEVTSKSLADFFDTFISATVKSGELPGAAIAVVQGGELVFSGGYGYADLENIIHVSPHETIFFVESVSKSFTATAVMQLADEGLIDLNADVNSYLSGFQLANTYPEPVTVADLLVHTGGFDDSDIGAYAKSENRATPLGDYLKMNMPARVMPPGKVVSYSNHGYALAGLVVEEVSGLPFSLYMEENILSPLAMNSSSFVLSEEMAQKLAQPYLISGDKFTRSSFLFHNYPPAGALKSTVEDMANFIIAQLNDGMFMEEQLLSAEAIDIMQHQQFSHHEALPGWAYGFYEEYLNGHRIIMHGGANRLGHSSKLFIMPDQQIGFFFATNVFNPQVRDKLNLEFMNHFFPPATETVVPVSIAIDPEHDKQYAGYYYSTRQARNSVEKIMLLLGQLKVEVDDGKLQVIYPPGSLAPDKNWVKIGSGLFENENGDALMAFREDETGKVTHMFIGKEAYERLPWHAAPVVQAGYFVITMILLLSIFIRRPDAQSRLMKGKTLAARLLASINIAFLVGVVIIFLNYQVELAYGMPAPAKVLFVVPFISLVLTASVLYFCLKTWLDKQSRPSYPLHYTFFSIGAVGFLLFLKYWNLIGIY